MVVLNLFSQPVRDKHVLFRISRQTAAIRCFAFLNFTFIALVTHIRVSHHTTQSELGRESALIEVAFIVPFKFFQIFEAKRV